MTFKGKGRRTIDTLSRVPNNLITINPVSCRSNNLPDNLSFYYQNVRGLRTKTAKVFVNSKLLDFDIFALTETWLHSGINSLELFDHSFSVFRKDRHNNNNNSANSNGIMPKGGGVMIAIKNSFNINEIILSQFPDLEIVAIKIELTLKSIFVICCYIPPNSTLEIYSKVCQAIDHISSITLPSDEIIVCSDFNLPHLT